MAVDGAHIRNGLALVQRYSATNVTLGAANDPQISAPKFTVGHFGFGFNSTLSFSYVVE